MLRETSPAGARMGRAQPASSSSSAGVSAQFPAPPRLPLSRRFGPLQHPMDLPGLPRVHGSLTEAEHNIDATFRDIISISAVVGISYSVLLAAVSVPPQEPPTSPGSGASGRKALGPGAGPPVRVGARAGSATATGRSGAAGGGDDNFVWGLMGFISCLPLFNWLAWVLAAISDEDRAPLYGIYAALYGSPLLLRGLDWQDPWVLLMLGLCVAHVQAERISATEPETLQSLRPVGALGGAVRGLLGGTGSLLRGLGGVLTEDSRRATRRPGGRSSSSSSSGGGSSPAQLGSGEDRLQIEQDPDLVSPGKQIQQDPRRDPTRDPDLEEFSARELRQFDEMLREKERKRRGGRGGA
ncbi:hypothetical protein GPECTOR_63g70 [Gonium pectorale]|uniref:Uncharacterized protein n=1 Tax=Gonium pectorale TaxID=33097 RepID=A0A150G4D9_GONPE|nr:hypothetical protein GPECTOR_63g70 [Gonium pectorale]|eukprot:KXZ44746.1 hypothetical protein GPECTOR_63g70 [Gonium pectorale]